MGKDERSDVRGRRPTQCRAGPNISAGPSKASYDNGGWQGQNWSSFQHVVIKRFNLGSQPGRKTNWSDRPLIPTRREQSRLSNGSHQGELHYNGTSSSHPDRSKSCFAKTEMVLAKIAWGRGEIVLKWSTCICYLLPLDVSGKRRITFLHARERKVVAIIASCIFQF